jgi:hypothetical protein
VAALSQKERARSRRQCCENTRYVLLWEHHSKHLTAVKLDVSPHYKFHGYGRQCSRPCYYQEHLIAFCNQRCMLLIHNLDYQLAGQHHSSKSLARAFQCDQAHSISLKNHQDLLAYNYRPSLSIMKHAFWIEHASISIHAFTVRYLIHMNEKQYCIAMTPY